MKGLRTRSTYRSQQRLLLLAVLVLTVLMALDATRAPSF
jgi:hypothetical protein